MHWIVGVDLGGTNIVVAIVSEDGDVLHGLHKRPTPRPSTPDEVVASITDMVRASLADTRNVLGKHDIDVPGIGIGSPGPLNTATGVVRISPNLGWRDVPLRQLVSDAVGYPATLENDANCSTMGEWWRGAARGADHVVGLTIGTGIGGGIMIGGEIFHGATDVAGEIGHTTIDSTGRRCTCGNYGCLEAYASGPAIALRAREGIEAGARSSLSECLTDGPETITAQAVYDAAQRGDSFALDVVRETARFLGIGLANIVNLFNPEVVVVCGGVTQAGRHLFDPLTAEVKRRAFRPAVDACRIVPGQLSGTAGIYGAVGFFRRQMGNHS